MSLARDGGFGVLTVMWRVVELEDPAGIYVEERLDGALDQMGPFATWDGGAAFIRDRFGRLKRAADLIKAEMTAERERARILAADDDEAPRR